MRVAGYFAASPPDHRAQQPLRWRPSQLEGDAGAGSELGTRQRTLWVSAIDDEAVR
ncbi:hypothetical protein Asera_08170 [Actinocatenispora sera]|uniref:Uncharacterized protein n=1 Tax=Actinocatenispora sera TaxID=390989 RepID=A0A810KWI7_9ACTN|nr:hypothetical protein Asera_08170 [Actinocatenispora sera]